MNIPLTSFRNAESLATLLNLLIVILVVILGGVRAGIVIVKNLECVDWGDGMEEGLGREEGGGMGRGRSPVLCQYVQCF